MRFVDNSLRQEIKYKVFLKDQHKLCAWLQGYSFFQKSYNSRKVNSLYFDTPNYEFASSNMSGESKRIKIRARWYAERDKMFFDSFLSDSTVFNFEVKRKLNSFSDKLNIGKVEFNKIDTYLPRVDSIKKELDFARKSYPTISAFHLISTVFTSYEREYFELKSNKNIRITIDKNISYCSSKMQTNLLLMAKDYVIVELKFPPHSREKIDSMLKNFPFRQVRSSKYLACLAQIQRVSY